MGQVRENKTLRKKYKNVLASREMVEDALDLDKRLKRLDSSLKEFEKEIDPFKDREQKKVRDFKL